MQRILAALVVAAAHGASASLPMQDQGRIVFSSDFANVQPHAALYSIGVDGRTRQRLVPNVDNTLSAQWSPNGRTIAFFQNPSVYVVPARGGRPRRIASVRGGGDTAFSWSPDGSRLAFFDDETLVVALAGPRRLVRRLVLPGSAGDRPAWSPDGKRILYVQARERSSDLRFVDLADGRTHLLLRSTSGSAPAWSPDGRTIAFSSGLTDIVLVDVHNRRTRRFRNAGTDPSWSPDGTRLAVTRHLSDVYVLDVRTGRRVLVSRRFSTDLRVGDDRIAWFSDSRRLLLPVGDDIYVVRADGRGRRRVWRHDAFLQTLPSLSPDGRRTAYVAEPNVVQQSDLYSVRPDGSELRSLTRNSFDETLAAWSPDGRRLAFVHPYGLEGEVLVMPVDGRARVVASGIDPAWAPDGRRLAYARDGDLYVIDPDGGREQLLLGGPALDSEPAWSPDGKRIAFTRRESSTAPAEVWTAAADGSGAVQLTHTAAPGTCQPEESSEPAWAPDGSEIAYTRGVSGGSSCLLTASFLQIRAIRPDGTGDRLVVGGGASGPTWSPDSASIAYTLTHLNDVREDPTYRIGVVERTGRNAHLLVAKPNSYDPDWSR